MIAAWEKLDRVDRILFVVWITSVFYFILNSIGVLFILDNIALFVAGFSTAGVALYLYNKKQKADKDAWLLRDEKAHLIESIDIVVSAADAGKNLDDSGKNLDSKKLEELFSRLKSASFLYSSSEMLECIFRHAINLEKGKLAGEINPEEQIKFSERILRMIRKELGHDDSRLPPGAFLQMILIKDTMKEEEKLAIRKGTFEICKDDDYSDIYGPQYTKPKAFDLP